MGAYRLSEEWLKITEKVGVLENTSQQNIEMMVVKEDIIPIKCGGKVIHPQSSQYFELDDNEGLWVRVFKLMPSGYIPTVSVSSVAGMFNREDNDLEGSTNFLTIGLSVWREEAWFPKDWCVIAQNNIWQCVTEHKPSSSFATDVASGYWKNLSTGAGNIASVNVSGTDLVAVYSDGTTMSIPITAQTSIEDGNGDNIVNTYVKKTDLNTLIAGYYTKAEVDTKVDNSIAQAQLGLTQTTTALNQTITNNINTLSTEITNIKGDIVTLGGGVMDVTQKDNITLTVTKYDGTSADYTFGDTVYVKLQDIASYISTASSGGEVGDIKVIAGDTIPPRWLLCDGSAISRTDYAPLFDVIGETYGAGDGTTTFNLPDTIGKFIEGGSTAGAYHSAGLPNITGSVVFQTTHNGSMTKSASGAFERSSSGTNDYFAESSSSTYHGETLFLDASKSNSVYGSSTTVQPPSVVMKCIIKYA